MKDKVTVRTLTAMKSKHEPITMLTAYDFPTTQLLDQAGVEMLLVGDSLGMVIQGHENTVGVTVRDMIYHGEIVARAAQRAMVIVDLPFPVGQLGSRHTVKTAAKIVKATGCNAIKMEGGSDQASIIERLVAAGMATIAHVGLRPQSVNALGGYFVQRDRLQIIRDARTAQDAGAFCILMECVPADLAGEITEMLQVPTIGIGAGPHCDGQVLVTNDMLGWNSGYLPKFVRQYDDLRQRASEAVKRFRDDVRAKSFPGSAESFK